jgi:hypothetical protein
MVVAPRRLRSLLRIGAESGSHRTLLSSGVAESVGNLRSTHTRRHPAAYRAVPAGLVFKFRI